MTIMRGDVRRAVSVNALFSPVTSSMRALTLAARHEVVNRK
jgi:hypothetical protein